MKKLLLSLSLLLTGAATQAQTVLLNETFDTYTDFAITGFGSWQTLDLDGLNTYIGGGGISWANATLPQAYMIFNPTTAGVSNQAAPTTADPETRNFDAHSGQKYAASWAAVPSTTGGAVANNDWLISPAVTLGAGSNLLSLWVKGLSATYTPERYKIGVYVGSGTPTASTNFTIISGAAPLTAPSETWQRMTYALDTYAGQTVRIGIQCTSTDRYMFMVDDVRITTGSLGTSEATKAQATNIYPNPTKGEINIKTDKKIKSFTVLDFSGKSVLKSSSNKVDISSLPKGGYLLQVEFTDGTTTTEKVIKE